MALRARFARRSRTLVLALLLAGALSARADLTHLHAKPEIRRETSTQAGEGVDGIKGLRASFYVSAPPDDVLELLWDVARFREVFPDIKKLRVLSREATRLDVEFHVDAVLADVSYTLRREIDREARLIRWREIAGDLERVRGSWRVEATEAPGVSRVTYASFVAVNAFVPESVYRDLAIAKVEEMAERVRKAATKPSARR